jgi:hypothetical protein
MKDTLCMLEGELKSFAHFFRRFETAHMWPVAHRMLLQAQLVELDSPSQQPFPAISDVSHVAISVTIPMSTTPHKKNTATATVTWFSENHSKDNTCNHHNNNHKNQQHNALPAAHIRQHHLFTVSRAQFQFM